ncbi:uncharacterized protein LOC132719359 [Ruditapes philippinarum]|uniref:uncharacterized protein LOC132719359 n=1 Tax=Ruditapes philippinarum TaxID=129788 RepID=UPI00295C20CC|nr:uncharacterized protein LOC132719359 [Ruditapes philippinarum]
MATPKRKLFKNLFATPRSKEKEPSEPWRDYKDLRDGWTQDYYKTMLTRIKANTTSVLKIEGVNSTTINIMMLGYVQSGKSATINSIFCILDGRISKRAKSGVSTQKYNSFRGEKELDDIILFDVMGVEAIHNQGILTEDIQMCLDGDIEEYYQVDIVVF